MRNEPKPLDHHESMQQARNTQALMAASGPVTVHYIKRNGAKSKSSGEVKFFNGRVGFDTGSVTIADPVKGNRTVNLHRIFKIE